MTIRTTTLIGVLAALLSACASTQGPKESTGMIIGGLLGGAIGHQIGDGHGQTVATVVGAIIGTAIGGSVGRSMDDTDRLKVAHSLETVRTGVVTSWRNPDTGHTYEMVPRRTFEQAGAPCREYQVTANIGGREEQIYGTACRQPDGSWKVIR